MKHAATKMVIPPIPNKCCSFEIRSVVNSESGINYWLIKGVMQSFVVPKKQASCLGWNNFCSLNGDSSSIASIQHLFKTVPKQVAQHLKAHCSIMWMKLGTDLS